MYRLYIDETGNADMGASNDPNHRYLSLTGVMVHRNNNTRVLTPEIESIKLDIFKHDPDVPIIFHRKEIINKNYPFTALRDPNNEEEFNRRLLALMANLDYRVFTVVIDKLAHLHRYDVWHKDPYHYCLEAILERYVLFLCSLSATGDVMAEVRGRSFDERLEKSYQRLHKNGNNHIPAGRFQQHLTSRDIKMRKKESNVAGLQFADLIAHPSATYAKSLFAKSAAPTGFAAQIIDVLVRRKYHRYQGRLEGCGVKWLP